MELQDALQQITEIRQQMARSEVFRGYRSLTVGFSGILALFAAGVQPVWIPAPEQHLNRYLMLWLSVALISIVVAGTEMVWRARASGSGWLRDMTRLAIEQFLPSLIVGAAVTLTIFRAAPDVAWMLPGLWSLIFSLGVFASWRLLPRHVFWVGFYYVACGCGCLVWGRGESVFSPWQMAVSFGGGQLISAVILYQALERNHDAKTEAV